jgi:DNA-binding MarR family transcriptional regulator
MKHNTVSNLTEEESREAVAKFDGRDILPLHSMSDAIKKHSSPYSPSDPLALELLISIFRTAGMLHGSQEAMLRRYNLTIQAWRTLGILFFNQDRAAPLHIISRMLGVTRPHVTGIIDTLEQDGLVERIAHPDDRRVTLAHLTDKGAERMIEVGPHYNVLVADLFNPFSEDEKEQLLVLLYRLRQHLTGDASSRCFNEESNG